MTKSMFSEENELRKECEGIEFLSEPSSYSMADEYYDFADSNHFWVKWRFDVLKKLVPREYRWGSILDVGCGHGIVGEQIERWYGHKVCGCDLNLKALRMASLGCSSLYFYNIHEHHKDFEKNFSTILLMDVLEHISDPIAFLNSVSFHLRPEGRLIINVPVLRFLYSKYDKINGHIKRYDILSLKSELNSAGFELEETAYWGMSLIPVLLLRKFLLCFCKDDKVVKLGFQPMSPLVGKILDFIRRCEGRVFFKVPIGTSLMIVAKKKV